MSKLFRECRAAAGAELVEAADGNEVLYLREPGGSGWHGTVNVHRAKRGEHATLHLEGLLPDQIADVLRALARSTAEVAVDGNGPRLDHDADPGRSAHV